MSTRTEPYIVLRDSNNNGGHYFMSLKTGHRIHGNKWTEVPISQDVIDRVDKFVDGSKHRWTDDNLLNFESEPGVKINEDIQVYNEASYEYAAAEDGNAEINERVAAANDNMNDIESLEDSMDECSIDDSDSTFILDSSSSDESIVDDDAVPDISKVNSEDFEFNLANVHNLDEPSNSRTTDTSSLEIYVTESEVIDLTDIPDKPQQHNESVAADSIQLMNIGEAYSKAVGVMFTQMLASRGIKLFGEKAVSAIFKEVKQLNDGILPGNPVIVPIDIESLTEEDKRKALEAVNLIKVKRCGKIKGRTCANGSCQRNFVKAEHNFASPTASLESILTTLIIDAYEGRDVAVADAPGAYLHAKFPKDKKVVLKLTGEFADIMCLVNPEYSKHIIYEVN